MNNLEMQRYSRQIQLPHVGEIGQDKLLKSRVLIVGLGGLGSPAALYLAAAGVGHLVICDYDRVELSNLQRQILHTTDHLGETKASSALQRLTAQNPDIQITALDYLLDDEMLEKQVELADVVLDCSDNFPTRFAINRACVKAKKPLVSGAAIRFEAQISVFDPRQSLSPCYECIYKDIGGEGDTCSRLGIFAPLTGVIGSLQAAEALKLLLNIGETLCGKLLIMDALTMEIRILKVPKDTACPTCGGG
jgi:adenylyltransferase/sulfurtransferase